MADADSTVSSAAPTTLRIESPAVVLDRRRVARLAGVAMVATYLGTCAHSLSTAGPLTPLWIVLAPLVFLLTWGALFVPRRRPGALSLNARGLVVERAGHARYYPPDAIEGGFVVPARGEGLQVELQLRGDTVVAAQVDSPATAEAFLAAARLDPARRRFRISAPAFAIRALGGTAGGLVAGIIGLLTFSGLLPYLPPPVVGVLWVLGVVAGAALTASAVRPPEVTVGVDGLVVRASFSTRFVPYAALAGVDQQRGDIYLRFRDGHTEVLRSTWLALSEAHSAALALRIREAMATGSGAAQGSGDAALAAALSRGGRAVREWRAALAQLFERATSYRAAPITHDEVARVLADPRSTAEQRIAAALALRARGETARIRVAVDACASDPVRVALAKVERDELDDATLEAALRAADARTTAG